MSTLATPDTGPPLKRRSREALTSPGNTVLRLQIEYVLLSELQVFASAFYRVLQRRLSALETNILNAREAR